MPFLVAAVALVGAVSLVNLVLTLGMTRRMRRYAEGFAQVAVPESGNSIAAGTTVAPFHATAVDGTPVDERFFSAPTLVGFFSPGCAPCRKLLPDFVAAAASQRALAVVEEGSEPADDYLAQLAEVGMVLVGDDAQQAIDAFAVQGFPAVCLVDAHGVVSATGVHLVESHPLVAG